MVMTEQEKITDWFIHEFWPNYPSKFCRNGKGSRQQAMNAMITKHKPNEEERRRIVGNLKAQVLADKKNPDRKWWVIGVTYVNNQMWEDEIEPVSEILKTEARFCHCGQQTIGPQYKTCERHTETREEKRQHLNNLKDLGLYQDGQSLSEIVQNCRAYLCQSVRPGSSLLKTVSEKLSLENAD